MYFSVVGASGLWSSYAVCFAKLALASTPKAVGTVMHAEVGFRTLRSSCIWTKPAGGSQISGAADDAPWSKSILLLEVLLLCCLIETQMQHG